MDWNKKTKIKIHGATLVGKGFEDGQDRINEFLAKKGDLVKDILFSSMILKDGTPYVCWTIIYED